MNKTTTNPTEAAVTFQLADYLIRGKYLAVPKAEYTILDNEVILAYKLHPAIAEPLGKLANSKCYKCNGTGISQWRNGGLLAKVCACIPKSVEVPAEAQNVGA